MKRFCRVALWLALWPLFVVGWTFAAIVDGPHEGHKAWMCGWRVLMRRPRPVNELSEPKRGDFGNDLESS